MATTFAKKFTFLPTFSQAIGYSWRVLTAGPYCFCYPMGTIGLVLLLLQLFRETSLAAVAISLVVLGILGRKG